MPLFNSGEGRGGVEEILRIDNNHTIDTVFFDGAILVEIHSRFIPLVT